MHRYLKPVALLAAAAGVLFLAAAGQASGRSTSSLYIVQFAGKPLATYAGGLKGFHATRPIKGARIDTHTTNAIGYRRYLANRQHTVLRSAGLSVHRVYTYTTVLNGAALRMTAEQAAKRIRIAALSKDAEALKISLIDRYPHLFAVDPPRPLASGIHRVLAEQTGAPMPVLKLALAKLTRRNAYLAALGAGGPRYDIDGRPSGMISPDDQQAATAALRRRLVRSPQAMARRKERKTAAAARS